MEEEPSSFFHDGRREQSSSAAEAGNPGFHFILTWARVSDFLTGAADLIF